MGMRVSELLESRLGADSQAYRESGTPVTVPNPWTIACSDGLQYPTFDALVVMFMTLGELREEIAQVGFLPGIGEQGQVEDLFDGSKQ